MSCRSVPCLADRTVHDGLQLHGDEGARFGDQRTDLDVCSAQGRHFDGDFGGAVVGPGVGEGVQAVTRIVARLVDLDLPDLEHVDLDLAVRRRKQYRGRLDRLSSSCGAEHLKLRHFTEQPVDDIEIGGGAVRIGEAAHHGQPADHHRRLADQGANFFDALDDRSHCVTDQRHALTRHGPTCPEASRH